MKIPRQIIPENIEKVEQHFRESNVLHISGPKGCGKTYVVEKFLSHFDEDDVRKLDGISIHDRILLMNNDVEELSKAIRDKRVLFIDSAQRVPNIDLVLQTISDIDASLKIIVAYSARVVENENQIRVYPIAFSSLKAIYPSTPDIEIISEMMIYGSLPQVLLADSVSNRLKCLDEIANIEVLRDLFELENIVNSKAIIDLLYHLALNINVSLSVNDISKQIGTNPRTTRRYLDLLEKHYIVHEHKPFRASISTQKTMFSRYYFYDLGVRNCLIQNFAPLNTRTDVEQIWANFLVMERHKAGELGNKSHSKDYESYFWETYSKINLDLVEVDKTNTSNVSDYSPDKTSDVIECSAKINVFKFGFTDVRKIKALAPEIFMKKYKNAVYDNITPNNFEEFVKISFL